MANRNKSNVDQLLRGVSTGHNETVRDAWRALLIAGNSATFEILDKLSTPAWADYPSGPFKLYLGVLLAVLDELDSAAFRAEITRLQQSKLHALHRMTVDLMAKRRSERPLGSIGTHTKVHVSDEVADGAQILRWLSKWAQTDGINLTEMHRIDVVALHPQLDYLGLYQIHTSGMVLTWPDIPPRGIRLWYHKISTEHTFYHEVGHHSWGHLQGGQDEDQEREANDFAKKRMRRAHPILTGIGRLLLPPVWWVVRWSLRKTKSGRRALREMKPLSPDHEPLP